MASLIDSASQFGVGNSQQDYDEEIYAPVRLSNSTRRYSSAEEMIQSNMDAASFRTQLEEEQLARRLKIDEMQDAAFNREIEKRVNAAAWNDKVRAQQQAGEVSQALIDLDPTDSNYQSQVDTILKDRPLARMHPEVSKLLEGRSAIYTEAQKERERQMALQDRAVVAEENIRLNAEMSRETQSIAREENRKGDLQKAVDGMNKPARDKFNEVLDSTKGNYEAAFSAARDIQETELTPENYKEANRQVSALRRDIISYRREMSALDKAFEYKDKKDEEYVTKMGELQDAIKSAKQDIQQQEESFIKPYQSKFGPPEDGTKPTAPDAPATETPATTEEPKATSDTPTIPLEQAIKKNPGVKPGQLVTVPVRDRRGNQVGTKSYLVTQ